LVRGIFLLVELVGVDLDLPLQLFLSQLVNMIACLPIFDEVLSVSPGVLVIAVALRDLIHPFSNIWGFHIRARLPLFLPE
jgi:hypothetical protein